MSTIFDLVTPFNVANKWKGNTLERQPYYGEALFEEKKQLGIEINGITGNKPKIKPLNLSSYDAKVIPLSREAFNKITTEIPFFKNSLPLDEKTRQELNKVLATGNRQYIDAVMNVYYNDSNTLLNNASVTREAMRMMILTTGVIAFSNNGVAVSYDYGVSNKVSKQWKDTSDSKADPVSDIEALMDTIENKSGVRPTKILMNSVTLNNLRKLTNIRNAILKDSVSGVFVSKTQVISYLQSELQATIVIYNKGYTDIESGAFTKFVPDNVISLYPEGYIGKGVFGTTPEESDLMSGATSAKVEIVDMGVAITVTKETDPVNVVTKVSESYLPTLDNPDAIGIITATFGE